MLEQFILLFQLGNGLDLVVIKDLTVFVFRPSLLGDLYTNLQTRIKNRLYFFPKDLVIITQEAGIVFAARYQPGKRKRPQLRQNRTVFEVYR